MAALQRERQDLIEELRHQQYLVDEFQNVRDVLANYASEYRTTDNLRALNFIENWMRDILDDYNVIFQRLNQIELQLNIH